MSIYTSPALAAPHRFFTRNGGVSTGAYASLNCSFTSDDPDNVRENRARVARVLVNCASGEYFKSVKPKLLEAPVITPVFEDWKGGRYKIISFHAKRARGLMARFAVENRLDAPEQLKGFDAEGYAFDAEASNDSTFVFRRRIAE